MTSKKNEELNRFNEETSELAYQYLLKDVPKAVIDFNKKHPSFVKKSNHVRFNGNGCLNIYISIGYLPQETESAVYITPTIEFGTLMEKRHNHKQDMEKSIKDLRISIEEALKSMRTFNKVKELFPEAYEFLPKTESVMLPSININSIREKLK